MTIREKNYPNDINLQCPAGFIGEFMGEISEGNYSTRQWECVHNAIYDNDYNILRLYLHLSINFYFQFTPPPTHTHTKKN